jgi:hypothetical protein
MSIQRQSPRMGEGFGEAEAEAHDTGMEGRRPGQIGARRRCVRRAKPSTRPAARAIRRAASSRRAGRNVEHLRHGGVGQAPLTSAPRPPSSSPAPPAGKYTAPPISASVARRRRWKR